MEALYNIREMGGVRKKLTWRVRLRIRLRNLLIDNLYIPGSAQTSKKFLIKKIEAKIEIFKSGSDSGFWKIYNSESGSAVTSKRSHHGKEIGSLEPKSGLFWRNQKQLDKLKWKLVNMVWKQSNLLPISASSIKMHSLSQIFKNSASLLLVRFQKLDLKQSERGTRMTRTNNS